MYIRCTVHHLCSESDGGVGGWRGWRWWDGVGVGVGVGGLRLPNNYFLYPVRCCPAHADGAYKPEFAGYICVLRTRRYAVLCYAIKESKVISVAVPPVAMLHTQNILH